jgi:hypothetical protein
VVIGKRGRPLLELSQSVAGNLSACARQSNTGCAKKNAGKRRMLNLL